MLLYFNHFSNTFVELHAAKENKMPPAQNMQVPSIGSLGIWVIDS